MPNKYDLTEIAGDLVGAALVSKVAYKSWKAKTLLAFVVGDVVYIYMLRKPLLTKLNVDPAVPATALPVIANTDIVDINQLTGMEIAQDLGGKLLATFAAKALLNLAMQKGSAFAGFKEILVMNIGGDIFGHGARYVQQQYGVPGP